VSLEKKEVGSNFGVIGIFNGDEVDSCKVAISSIKTFKSPSDGSEFPSSFKIDL
jgi:hypothetical protein